MIKKEDILKELQNLVGEKVDNYEVTRVIRKLFESFRNDVYQNFSWNHNHQNIWFYWCGRIVININYQKKKGETHYSMFSGSHTEYKFKGFEVSICDADTLEEAMEKAEESNRKCQQQKNENNLKSMEMLEVLMKAYPEIDKYALGNYIKNINSYFYIFFDKIKEKEAGN